MSRLSPGEAERVRRRAEEARAASLRSVYELADELVQCARAVQAEAAKGRALDRSGEIRYFNEAIANHLRSVEGADRALAELERDGGWS